MYLKPLLIIYDQLRIYIFVKGFRKAYQWKGLYLREFITGIKKFFESSYNDADQYMESNSFQYIWRGERAHIRGFCIRMLFFVCRQKGL